MTGRAKVHLRWYLESRVDDKPALFVTAKKPYSRITKNGVEYLLKEIGKKTGLDIKGSVNPHKFRSTLATNMLNRGADIALVQGTLGFKIYYTILIVVLIILLILINSLFVK
jgi:site-specific recombinase XerD